MLKEGVQTLLPQWWTPVCSDTSIQLSMMKVAPMSSPSVERSITIDINMTWYAHARGRILTRNSNKLLRKFPALIHGMSILLEIIDVVTQATMCPGNPDPEFVEVIEKRGGTIHSPNGQVMCMLDSASEITNHDGRVYGRTNVHVTVKRYYVQECLLQHQLHQEGATVTMKF